MKQAKKSVLIVWGGWEGHTPESCARVFADWLAAIGFRVVVSDSLDIFANKQRMRRFDVVIPVWTMGKLSGDQWAGLQHAVMNGTGVAGFHGGMCDAFREHCEYQFMTGGQFVAHPGGIIRYRVNITSLKDPITRGLNDFWVHSEQYYMHVDPANRVLATTRFSGKHGDAPWVRGTIMPVAWKRTYGPSRIFYSALGHEAGEFDVPETLEIQKRGILWAAGLPVKAEYTSA
jgi:type 1 glutamine amidotransferase